MTNLHSNATDEDLIHFVKRGNRAAMSEVIRRYRGQVLEYCERRAESTGAAFTGELLATETFLFAFKFVNLYRGGNVSCWLIHVAEHRVKHYRRKDARALVGQHG